MELETTDVVHIKDKDTQDLHKMCTTKKFIWDSKRKKKRFCYGSGGKWHERRLQYPAWGKNYFKCPKMNYFSSQCQNEQQETLSKNTQEPDTFDISMFMTSSGTLKPISWKLELNEITCEKEIDTECSSSLISEKQFYELSNGEALYKKWVIQRLRTNSAEVIIPKGVAILNVKYKRKNILFKNADCTRIGTMFSWKGLTGMCFQLIYLRHTTKLSGSIWIRNFQNCLNQAWVYWKT